MGRVTYEYGYRVALAHSHALHSDSEVEEDPFTIHPEDDLLRDVDLAHLTCVRSAVRPLTPLCPCQAGFPVSGRHVGGPVV
ncbi:hypothetical protein BHM03_00018147 [Ensete ventricosum]|nr:hypothetical protein BHM03_00018147 [Ensete ventricosum]